MEKAIESIKSLIPTSLVDWDGKVSAVIFLSRCNFRCGFCSNRELVIEPEKIKSIPFGGIKNMLEKNKEFIDGIVITGGEPTIHEDLAELCREIKKLNYKIKLDTNGSNPEVLRELIDKKMVDYVALDIKTSKERYKEAINLDFDIEKVEESIKLIVNSGLDYEFRTTIAPSIVELKDIEKIKSWLIKLAGKDKLKAYYLQQFNNEAEMIDVKFKEIKLYKKEVLEEMKSILKDCFEICKIRG